MVRLSIRIDFEGSESFGPGKARLLELIDEHGSIRSAAAAMKMSYRHAWLLVQAVEDTFGAPVISTATGGAKGGGAKLTELGRSLLAKYRAIRPSRQGHGRGPGLRAHHGRQRGRTGSKRRARTPRFYFPTITSDDLPLI
jgi:molybdate transport system regulatory protein